MSNRKANKGRQAHKHKTGPVKITKDTAGVSIQLIPEDEIEGPEGFFASGDDAADRELVAAMLRRLRDGDIWAWFTAHVRVTFDGLTSDQYLGACSYENEADFRRDGFQVTAADGTVSSAGYFSDMVSEAIDDLNAQIAKRDHFEACAHCAAVSKGEHLPDAIRA